MAMKRSRPGLTKDMRRGSIGMPRMLKKEESLGDLHSIDPESINGASIINANIFDSERQQYCGFVYVTRVSQSARMMRIGDLLHASTSFFAVLEHKLSPKARHRNNYSITW